MITNHTIEGDWLKIPLDTGGTVSIHMLDVDLCYYGDDCDIELHTESDDLKDLIFMIGGKYWTGLNIVQWYNDNQEQILYEQALAEAELCETIDLPKRMFKDVYR